MVNGVVIDKSNSTLDEWIAGSNRDDSLTGGAGNDTIWGYAGDDTLAGKGGNNVLYGNDGNDSLAAIAGSGVEGDNLLDGGDGNDTLIGASRNVTMIGGEGDDTLVTYCGNNTMTGGAGRDFFNIMGPGSNVITDYSNEKNNTETVRMAGDISKTVLTNNGRDIVFTISGPNGDTLTLQGAADKTINLQVGAMNLIKDTKLYTMSKTALTALAGFGGTLDARVHLSTITTVDGRAATKDMTFYGNDLANTIYGGNYKDFKDELYGLAGNDTLYGYAGDDTLDGGVGADYLDGGAGDDVLYGGAGKDTFAYATSTGKDTINDYATGDVLSITGGAVTKAAVSGSNVVFTVGSGTVTVKNAETKTVSIKDSRGNYTMSKTGLTLSSNFGGTMDAAQYLSTVKTINGKSAAKALNITGNGLANTVTGSKYNDTLAGGAGNDTLTGGAGKDTFVYRNGDGSNTINDYEAGKDTLYLAKGAFKSTTISGKNLVFNVGSGKVTMKKAAGKTITLKNANGGIYTMTKTALKAQKGFGGTMSAAAHLSSITDVNGAAATKASVLQGNGKANTITGGSANDKLYGQNGNDKLIGGKGGDYLDGGVGNDTLTGGVGNDTFVYAQNTGKDIVNDYNKSGKDTLYISKGSIKKVAVSGSNMVFTVGSGTITLKGAGSKTITVRDSRGTYTLNKTTLTLTNTFKGAMNPSPFFSTITTINGKSATKAVNLTGNAKNNNVINGGKGNDTLKGGAGNDKLYGNAGNDYLDGGAGNDVLYGGAGNNSLHGGAGSDIFQYGGGNDVINDYEVGKDTIRLNSYTLSSAKVSGKNVILKLTNGKTITVNGMANKNITIVDSKGKKRVLSVSSVSQQNVIKKFMKSLDNATTSSGLAALNAAVFYASGGLCADWNTLVNSFVSDVAKYGGKGGGNGTEYDHDLKKWLPDASTHAFLIKYCGIDLTNEDSGALTGKDAGGKSIKTVESIVDEGSGFGNSVRWYTVLNLNGVTFNLPTEKALVDTVRNNPNIDIDSAKWITGALYEKWIPAALKLVENTFGLSYNETDVPRSSHTVEVSFDYVKEAGWVARANATSLTINMYYWNGIDIHTGESSGSYGTDVESSWYFDRTLAHELTHAVMCANLNHDLWQSLYRDFGCVLEGTAELTRGIDDQLFDIVKLAQASNVKALKSALTGGYGNSGSINSDVYEGGYMLFRYLAKQVAEGRVFNAVSSSATMASASPAMAASAALLADSSAMLVGSADAQLSSLVSVTTAGSLGSLTTSGTGLISVDASGNNLVATNGSESNNVLTNKNRIS